MNWISEKTYLPFLLLIPIILFIGFLKRKETLDVNIHATYYVINNLNLSVLISTLLGVISLGYYLSNMNQLPLIKWVTISHVLITFFGLLLAYILFSVQINLESKTSNIEFFLKYSKTIERITLALISIIGITILSQFMFFINLILCYIKK